MLYAHAHQLTLLTTHQRNICTHTCSRIFTQYIELDMIFSHTCAHIHTHNRIDTRTHTHNHTNVHVHTHKNLRHTREQATSKQSHTSTHFRRQLVGNHAPQIWRHKLNDTHTYVSMPHIYTQRRRHQLNTTNV